MPKKELPIMEDLVRMLLPHSRQLDVFEEAIYRYKEIKRMQKLEQIKQQQEAIEKKRRSDAIAAHGYIESMANGKIYSSKRAYLADAYAMGYIDVGGEDMVALAEKARKEKQKKYEKERDQHIETIVSRIIN
jgi:hypothetical protein